MNKSKFNLCNGNKLSLDNDSVETFKITEGKVAQGDNAGKDCKYVQVYFKNGRTPSYAIFADYEITKPIHYKTKYNEDVYISEDDIAVKEETANVIYITMKSGAKFHCLPGGM